MLFQTHDAEISGFGSVIIEFASIEGKASICNGGAGAAIFNRSIFVGGYGLHLSHDLNKQWNGELLQVDFSHGGLLAGYLFRPHKMIHFGLSSRLGWGVIRISPENSYISSHAPSSDSVVIWTPHAEVDVNIAYWLKINGGIGYRTVGKISNPLFEAGDFDSPAVSIALLFGWFK